jgi:hypothetical protein
MESVSFFVATSKNTGFMMRLLPNREERARFFSSHSHRGIWLPIVVVLVLSFAFFALRSYVLLMACLLLAMWGTYSFYAARRQTAYIKRLTTDHASALSSSVTAFGAEVYQRELAEDELDSFLP